MSQRLCPAGATQFVWRGDEAAADEIATTVLPLHDDLAGALPARRREFAVGRYCAAEALRELTGEAHRTVGRAPDRSPCWPPGIVGSISHTRGVAWALVGRRDDYRGLGVDVEAVMNEKRARTVEARIATQGELAAIADAGGVDHQTAVTIAFSVKEALFKCLYAEVGRIFGFRDVRLGMPDPASGRMPATLVTTLAATLPRGLPLDARFERDGDYVFAAAWREEHLEAFGEPERQPVVLART